MKILGLEINITLYSLIGIIPIVFLKTTLITKGFNYE